MCILLPVGHCCEALHLMYFMWHCCLHLNSVSRTVVKKSDNDDRDPLKLETFKSAKISSLLSTLNSMLI
jgi:hypothetical protein